MEARSEGGLNLPPEREFGAAPHDSQGPSRERPLRSRASSSTHPACLLVGHSGGAYIALAFAIEHPELTRSLVLAEAPVLPLLSRTAVGDALRDSWNATVLDPVRSAFENEALEEGLRRFLDAVISPGWFDERAPQAREELVKKQGPTFRLYMLTDPSRTLPSIACKTLGQFKRPTLLVTGEQSPAMLLLASAELERCLSDVSHVMVPEAGHAMPSANPAFFNKAVLTFLRRP